jgi:predicted metalloprotease
MKTQAAARRVRRVGLIVTVLVAALALGACGKGGAIEDGAATEPGRSTSAEAVTERRTVDGDLGAGTAVETDRPDSGAALGDGGSSSSVKALHRPGEWVEPGVGTGSWSSMHEFLEFVLFDANGYWQSVFAEYGLAAPYVEYVFPMPGEVYDTSCGLTDDRSAFYCPADDLIVFSQQMAVDLWDGTFTLNGRQVEGGAGDMAPAFIVAHEFAHSLQSEMGYLDGQFTTLQTELHADCWAGVWAASADAAGMFDDGDIEESLLTAWLIGDTDDPDRTHGIPEERIDAFFTGFDTGHPLMCGTYLGF